LSAPGKSYTVKINYNWCKNCGICVEFCPKDVFDEGEHGEPVVERQDDCTGCMMCVLRCPDFAVNVRESGSDGPDRTEEGSAA